MAFVLVGIAGVAFDGAYLFEAYRESRDPGSISYTAQSPLVDVLMTLRWTFGWYLVCLGLLGLHALLPWTSKLPRLLILTGTVLTLTFAVLVTWDFVLYVVSPSWYMPMPAVLFWSLPTGVVLAGIGAVWARGLGRFKFFVPLASLLSIPAATSVLAIFVYPEQVALVPGPVPFATEVLVATPQLLGDAGFLVLGLFLFGAEKRWNRLLSDERHEQEMHNLALARRLYGKVLTKEDPPEGHDLFDPDPNQLFSGNNYDSLGRCVVELRRSFPDLEVTIEGHAAAGDVVITRCSFSGTDSGGVLWFPPTNRRARFSYTFTDCFEGGRLVEHTGSADDTPDLLRQLGLPPITNR